MLGSLIRRYAVVIVIAALACENPTVPIANFYVLRSIANVPLPAPYAPNPDYSNRLLSGSLILYADGTGQWQAVAELEFGGESFDMDSDLEWSRDGNDLMITFECDDIASCIAGPHFSGTLSGDRLTVPTSNIMRTPLVFEAQL